VFSARLQELQFPIITTKIATTKIINSALILNFNKRLNELTNSDISNQQDAAKFVSLILVILLYMFRATVSLVSGAL